MKLKSVTLHQVSIPLVTPFETSFMRETEKDCYLVEAVFDTAKGEITGWGESVAMISPLYSSEYVAAGIDVTRRWLAPLLFDVEDLTAETVSWHLRHVIGHPMAKSALEMAVIEAQLKLNDQSFKDYLGGVVDSVPSGVSVGIQDSVEETVDVIGGYLEEGYARIKLKIKPGKDIAPVAAVRRAFGDDFGSRSMRTPPTPSSMPPTCAASTNSGSCSSNRPSARPTSGSMLNWRSSWTPRCASTSPSSPPRRPPTRSCSEPPR